MHYSFEVGCLIKWRNIDSQSSLIALGEARFGSRGNEGVSLQDHIFALAMSKGRGRLRNSVWESLALHWLWQFSYFEEANLFRAASLFSMAVLESTLMAAGTRFRWNERPRGVPVMLIPFQKSFSTPNGQVYGKIEVIWKDLGFAMSQNTPQHSALGKVYSWDQSG
jgi:hypothetical protein